MVWGEDGVEVFAVRKMKTSRAVTKRFKSIDTVVSSSFFSAACWTVAMTAPLERAPSCQKPCRLRKLETSTNADFVNIKASRLSKN